MTVEEGTPFSTGLTVDLINKGAFFNSTLAHSA